MTRRAHRTIKQAEQAIAAGAIADAAAAVYAALDAAASLRQELPAVSRNDPVGVIERLLARRSNRRADHAERLAASAFPQLSPADQAEVLRRLAPRLRAIVALLFASERAEERRAALAVLAATGDWALVPHAARLIGSEARDENAAAIDAIAAVASTLDQGVLPESASFERSVAAVLDAASQHGLGTGPAASADRGALDLALLLLTPAARAGRFGAGPRRWLEDASQAIELALRASMRTLGGRLGAGRAFELVAHPNLRRAAVERVAASESPEELESLVARAHLGRRPLRRSAVRSRLEPAVRASLAVGVETLGDRSAHDVPVCSSRGVPDWVDLMGLPASQRTPLLEPLLVDPDPAARLSAVLVSGDDLWLDQAMDDSEPVAFAAATQIGMPSARDPAHALVDHTTRALLKRSRHRSVRRLAERMPASHELHPASIVALRARMRREPGAVIADLTGRITSADGTAIELAARLECADELLVPLEAALRSGDAQVAARAATALASARSPEADALLHRCLGHDEPRVRANGVEASAFRARRWKRSPLVLRLDDPHHRPASTSLRAQLLAGTADAETVERVRDLVASDEPQRRAAGLWVTERSAGELKPIAGRRWAEIAARVAESARNGESFAERTRATRCARRMLAVTVR